MRVTLTVIEGPHQGQVFAFEKHDTFIVGRGKEAHFRLPAKDQYFSRHHFLVEVNPPACRLMDMASTNGTFVNGQRIMTVDLHPGDLIKGGETVLRVAVEATAPQPETELELGPQSPAAGFGTLQAASTPAVPSPAPPHAAGDGPPTIPNYRLDRKLGEGGMGVVHLARCEANGAAVAIKLITPAVAAQPKMLARFLREASVMHQLNHPGIVGFREIGLADGRIFLVMEYIEGCDAVALLSRNGGPLPVAQAVRIACQALEALAYAHHRKFVHRDIKPHNLLIADPGGAEAVKLADFGLARLYQDSPLSGLSVTTDFAGTEGFMPPEQITSFRESKPTVDQYALAATLYGLLTGHPIYDLPRNALGRIRMILASEPVPIRQRCSSIPEALAAVIHRALARDPDARFPDATAFHKTLLPFTH